MTEVEIDGSFGEGGGQILRSALSLSMVTGRPLRMHGIRAGRSRPGLMRQHLTAVRAAVEISGGRVDGDAVGSTALTFRPGTVRAGEYRFAIGTAGSTTLVLQTVLPALMLGDHPSTVTLQGGTHNVHAPSADYLTRAFLPLLARMGPRVDVEVERHGFYPAGGGSIRCAIAPVPALTRIDLTDRGAARGRRAEAAIAGLSPEIAKRELAVVANRLGWAEDELAIRQLDRAVGPGNTLSLVVEFEHVTEVFTGFGERGVSAETVATRAADATRRYLTGDYPVGPHLADQLLLPMALAGGGRFTTGPVTRHTETNAHVIQRFLDVEVDIETTERMSTVVVRG